MCNYILLNIFYLAVALTKARWTAIRFHTGTFSTFKIKLVILILNQVIKIGINKDEDEVCKSLIETRVHVKRK